MALTLERAQACIARGMAKAQELGFRVAIAVVDEAGHLVACHRMDGALWITPEIARAKANAAAAFQTTTADLEERFAKRMLFADNVASLGDYRLVFGKGAVPLVEAGHIVGAVGVSGAVPAENDHTIAGAAAGHESKRAPSRASRRTPRAHRGRTGRPRARATESRRAS